MSIELKQESYMKIEKYTNYITLDFFLILWFEFYV